jgi:hypothetical protein
VTLNANILLSIVANETDAGDYAKDVRTTKMEYFKELTDGTGANQAQIVWSATRVIDGTEVDNISLRSLTDDRGTIVFSKITAWYIKNRGFEDLILGTDASEQSFPTAAWPFWPTRAGGGFYLGADSSLFYLITNQAKASVTSGSFAVRISGSPGGTYDILFIGDGTIT